MSNQTEAEQQLATIVGELGKLQSEADAVTRRIAELQQAATHASEAIRLIKEKANASA